MYTQMKYNGVKMGALETRIFGYFQLRHLHVLGISCWSKLHLLQGAET